MSNTGWPWPAFSGFAGASGIESFYYDTGLLSLEDRQQLGREKTLEGEYLWIAPGRRIKVFEHTADCIDRIRGKPVTVCVAGVGSSLFGAAAFAKSLMQVTGEAVVAVISHYGVVNLQAEVTRRMLRSGEATTESERASTGKDLKALQDLMLSPELQARYLVGHSRGARLIADLVTDLNKEQHSRLPEIVTFGCVVELPESVSARQYLGSLDWVGRISSSLDTAHEIVRGCGHHMNPMIPGRMDPGLLLEKSSSGQK